MHLDTTINLGNLITIASVIIAMYGLKVASNREVQKLHDENLRIIAKLETKIDAMWNWFTNQK